MNVDELNAKYDEIYNKNIEIHKLLSEVEDHNDILIFLYNTDIRRPNTLLNTMIDDYESLIFKLREANKEIKASLKEFGDEEDLVKGILDNGDITVKAKELILWKLRRLFMVYDEEPLLPYTEGDFVNLELIAKTEKSKATPSKTENGEEQVKPEGGVFPPKSKTPVSS